MTERNIHRIFVVSVAAKGLHALIEIAGGLALYLLSSEAIADWIRPHEWAASHFKPEEQHFYAFYLLSHGLVKVLLVIGLLKGKAWSYPASLIVLGLFVAYQLYRYSYTQSVGLLVLTAFDVVVMALIWWEYRLVRRNQAAGKQAG